VVADCGFGCLPPPRPPHGRNSLSSASAITRSLLQDRHLWAAQAVAAWGVGPAGVSAESHGISYTAEPCGIEQFTVEGCCQDRRGDGSRVICVAPRHADPPSVSDMTGAMPQPRRDTFTEFPARGHRGMIVRYPTAVMARSGGSSLRQLVGSPRHTEGHQSIRRRSCHSSTSTATSSSLTVRVPGSGGVSGSRCGSS
jgi:hypothetical protein